MEDTEQSIDATDLIGAVDPADDGGTTVVKPKRAVKKAEGMPKPKRVKIYLEENEDIPPTGLPLSLNGNAIVIVAGEPVEVPAEYLEVLDQAVMSAPVTNPQTRQVIDYRDRLRFPYRRL